MAFAIQWLLFPQDWLQTQQFKWWLLGLVVFIHSLRLWLMVAFLPNPFLLYILLGKSFFPLHFGYTMSAQEEWDVMNLMAVGWFHELLIPVAAMPCHATWLPLWMSGRISSTTPTDWLGCNVELYLVSCCAKGTKFIFVITQGKDFLFTWF